MIEKLINRLCDGDKRKTVINRILGKLITVRAAQKLSHWAGL